MLKVISEFLNRTALTESTIWLGRILEEQLWALPSLELRLNTSLPQP
jgi:hypothetical protein